MSIKVNTASVFLNLLSFQTIIFTWCLFHYSESLINFLTYYLVLLDSDDESEGADLAERLAGIDLDNADQVWEQLSEEERRQFEELLQSGDVSEVVPTWEPWWLYK